MRTQILYRSRTGNTEKIAKAVFTAIEAADKDIARLEAQSNYDMADIYFVGFWTDRGSADVALLDFLGALQGKKIALFGTCGMGGSPEYYKKIEDNIRVFIEDDNEYLGAFMCQGKMPIQVREKYSRMRNGDNGKQIDAMIRNFDEAMLHPDAGDIKQAQEFARAMMKKAEGNEK